MLSGIGLISEEFITHNIGDDETDQSLEIVFEYA